jgi:hypothetical protein
MWALGTVDAVQSLLDRQIFDAEGAAVAKVDDVELELHPGSAPTICALLSGPLAFGPRLGGRLGVWWSAIGRRLRTEPDPEPVRFDFDRVERFDLLEVRLDSAELQVAQFALRMWTREKIIARLPGGSR